MSDAASQTRLQVNRGLAWIGLASTAVGVLDWLALLINLRYFVTAEHYGIAGLAVTLFPILDLATDLGLSSAVIQRDDHSRDKISTIFWINLGLSFLLLGLLALGAPLLGKLHGEPVIGLLLIAYGSKLVFQNVYFIPGAMMRKQLRYKELSVIRIVANCAEFGGKVGFAAAGFPIWCWVFGPLLRVLVSGIGIQICNPWRPRFVVRIREAREYLTFGLKTSASQILFFFYTNVDYQVVAVYFGTAAIGLYRAAYELILEPVRVMSHVIVDIAFPVFARLRQRRAQLVEQFIAFTRQNLVVVMPFVALILLVAPDALTVFLSEEWTVAGTAARILCVVGLLRALSFIVPPLLNGLGYPSLTLAYTLVAAVVLPVLFVACAEVLGPELGYASVAVAWAIGYPIAFGVLLWLALRLIGLTLFGYARRIGGIVGCTALALGCGAIARALAAGASPGTRLAIVTAATLLPLGVLLAYLQGISPRSVARALRAGRPAAGAAQPEGTDV